MDSFCIRPFTICSGSRSLSYDFEITGRREGTKRMHSERVVNSFPIRITISERLGRQPKKLELKYSESGADNQQSRNEDKPFMQIFSDSSNTSGPSLYPAAQISARVMPATTRRRRNIALMMPVFDGYRETLGALGSLSRYMVGDRLPFDLKILIGLDNPSNHKLNNRIKEEFSGNARIKIFQNPCNYGFIENCNMLFRHVLPWQDILLMNSDVIAPSNDWIERLIEWADLDESIATVTPLSNRATIYSFPEPNKKDQPSLHSLSISVIDNLLATTNQADLASLVDTPSCHGFCTLILNSRLRLRELFDTDYVCGYCEENDLSCRVRKQGFRNIAAHNVYLYHRESVSFSEKKDSLIAKNMQVLMAKHPEYKALVDAFCQDDPLREYRNKAIVSHIKELVGKKQSTLHVSHFRGGGTDRYVREYSLNHPESAHLGLRPHNQAKGYVELFLIAEEDALREAGPSALLLEAELHDILPEIIDDLSISRVIMHSLIDFLQYGDTTSLWVKVAARADLWIVTHDYHWINTCFNLLDSRSIYKESPWRQIISDINTIRRYHASIKTSLLSECLEGRIRSAQYLFSCATKIIFPCSTTLDIYSKCLTIPKASAAVVHHDQTDSVARSYRTSLTHFTRKSGFVNVAVIGAIGMNKGYESLVCLAKFVSARKLPIRIFVIGWSADDKELIENGVYSITGKYNDSDIAGRLRDLEIDCALFLSQWPETYSYTLSIAFENKLFPFVLGVGAQSERVKSTGFGCILKDSRPETIAESILSRFHGLAV